MHESRLFSSVAGYLLPVVGYCLSLSLSNCVNWHKSLLLLQYDISYLEVRLLETPLATLVLSNLGTSTSYF